MTISSEVASASFVGNGVVTAFPCGFKIFDAAHIAVYVEGVLQTLNSHYTVSGVGGESFTVNFNSAPASLAAVSVFRAVPLLQQTDYISNDAFPAETHERVLDLLTMMVQQNAVAVKRSVRARIEEPADTDMALPTVGDRRGKLLAFDGDGKPVAANGTEFGILTTGSQNTWTARQTFTNGAGQVALRVTDVPVGIDLITLRQDSGGGGLLEVLNAAGQSAVQLDGADPNEVFLELHSRDSELEQLGPIAALYRNKTGVINQLLGAVFFEGNDTGGVRTRYAQINSSIHNTAPLEGQLDVAIRINNSMENAFRVDSAGLIPRAGAFWEDATSVGEGPYCAAFRKVLPSAGHFIGGFVSVALNSAGEQPNYFKLKVRVNDPTDGAEDSDCDIQLYDGGTQFNALGLRSDGLYLRHGPRVLNGAGSPEGAVSAPVGSIFLRSDGGANTTLYVKQSGTGNTGWAAK